MRGLKAGEVALLEEAFGDLVDLARVRLRSGAGRNATAIAAFRKGNTAITLRSSIYFRTHYSDDFSEAGVLAQSLLHHELTHVWQYSKLGITRFLARYARELAACRFNARAMYRYEEGETPFAGARLEAQAQMVGDYCHARLVGDEGRMARLERNLKGSGFYGL
ncbi:MAG TPA: DUF4157 domain-containing protein [Allosphingosinicella sp.]|nr:DUF4157 domain-containing protein [Allosphingosinicella sp.]